MLINVSYDGIDEDEIDNVELIYGDIIDVPVSIGVDLDNIQSLFFEWLNDKNKNTEYWTDQNKIILFYDTNAFIYWLNNIFLHDSEKKASIVELNAKVLDKTLPTIFF